MIRYYSVLINKEGRFYVAHCPELEVTSQGESVEEAENNLREAIELYIESFGIDEVTMHRQPPLVTSIAVDVA
jgi:predicted RNase H-like HicB family nuclease